MPISTRNYFSHTGECGKGVVIDDSIEIPTSGANKFNDIGTDTQGYIARDDSRKEIIVSFRGSIQLQDFVTGKLFHSDKY